MTQRDVTHWPARPRAGSVRLKPQYVRALHMSIPSQKQAKAMIERTAELIYVTATAVGSAR